MHMPLVTCYPEGLLYRKKDKDEKVTEFDKVAVQISRGGGDELIENQQCRNSGTGPGKEEEESMYIMVKEGNGGSTRHK